MPAAANGWSWSCDGYRSAPPERGPGLCLLPRRSAVAKSAAGNSTAGHRREKRDLAGPGDRRIGPHMAMIDGGADHLRVVERVGVLLVAAREPSHELAHRPHARRRIDLLLGLAHALADPGEIQNLHASSRPR